MPRIRTIKPELTLDEELAALGFAARYFFVNLLCHCDREGRLEDRPAKLQVQILPWDKIDVNILLDELSPRFLVRYMGSDGRPYIQVRNFKKHQKPSESEKKSQIPEPSEKDLERSKNSTIKQERRIKNLQEELKSSGKEGKGRERKGKELAGSPPQDINYKIIIEPNKPEVKIVKPLTGIQKVIRGFKEAKGIDANNKDWDSKFFPRYARVAGELLKAFNGDAEAAIVYTLTKGEEWKDLPDWGLDAVVKCAGREYNRIGGEHGPEYREVGANSLDGARRVGGTSSARAIVGDTLRAIEGALVQAKRDGLGEDG